MIKGRIIKAIAGFYYVHSEDLLLTCKARGVFKKKGISPLVGDIVSVSRQGMQEGIIEAIDPRKNEIIRPKIANIDQVALVFSLASPQTSLFQIDKMLAMTKWNQLPAIMLLTKIDLMTAQTYYHHLLSVYQPLGYKVLGIDSLHDQGIKDVKKELMDHQTVLSGESGVGKSTLLKKLLPNSDAIAGSVSEATQRGKHTTTFVQLYPFEGGYLADTPGFSQFDLYLEDLTTMQKLFVEIYDVGQSCLYRGCLHEMEDGCQVRQAVEQKAIASTRYENYLQLLQENKEWKARRY